MSSLDTTSPDVVLSPGRVFRQRWESVLAKTLLSLGGLWLLYSMSHAKGSIVVVAFVVLASYAIATLLARGPSTWMHKATARCAVPAGLLLVVLFNMFGIIGTLTGARENIAFASPLLIAFPFYILSVAAFITDISTRRLAMPRFLDYFTYIVLPFKLLAGPLEPPELLAKVRTVLLPRSWLHLAAAWPWVTLGLFMKFVIANRLNPGATLGWTDPLSALYTASVFELKFYFDFAGYTFMGYGAALACGLRINRNFAHPFFAPNVVLFWRRWHMSLGRFLTRYLLEPNVMAFGSKLARMVFTSSIFLASAMWHGGTGNYLLWGLFHGIVYFSWTRWMKKRNVPTALGIAAMITFFIMGRFLAIDANFDRLTVKLMNLFSVDAWSHSMGVVGSHMSWALGRDGKGVLAAALFLAFEGWTLHKYGVARAYHAFRRPTVAFALFVGFLIFARDQGTLLYGRI